jgi:hypothetical protein
MEPYTLLSIIPDKHAELLTDVLRDPDGRLYSPDGHPLIDYNSVYRDGQPRAGIPVLKMLRTIKGDALFNTNLTPDEVNRARIGLVSANSYITDELARQFETLGGITLTDNVRVTDAEGRDAWLLTEPGRGLYLVEEVSRPAPGFAVSTARLELVHSDLTAIITGPRAGRFPFSQDSPTFIGNPALPDRRQPYREFTIIYHFVPNTVPAFKQFEMASTTVTFAAGLDQYGINYGTAAIGPEVVANRIGVGPMGNADAVDLKFEEFFLSSWAVGDPSMIVDVPANVQKPGVHWTPGKPLFTVDATPALVADLDKETVDADLRAKFKAAGVDLSGGAIASPVCAGREWVVLDPGAGNTVARPSGGRYPVVAATEQRGGQPVKVLNVFPGPLGASPAVTGAATKALYPDDPSNVYHSNLRDHTKFRILHAGPGPAHVHHLHAHQWLHTPNDTESQYLDSQLIIPGSAYTLDIVYNGSGNRNMTVGDSIFHCHFYPHFAKGMWSLWRVHDVFESGTRLDVDGRPVQFVDERDNPAYRFTKDGRTQFYVYDASKVPHIIPREKVSRAFNRALPDGEIEPGTPIPAIVPLPSLAEPPVPPPIRLTDLAPFYPEGEGQGRRVYVEPKNAKEIEQARAAHKPPPQPEYDNPGYPFFIPGVAGHRAPHPPLDFAWKEDPDTGRPIYKGDKKVYLDGGLPRHIALGGQIVKEYQTRWDFTREFVAFDKGVAVAGKLDAMELPEEGTPVERSAMEAHSHRTLPSYLPNGDPGNVTRNGLPALPGAPYAAPMADDDGNANYNTRRYQAAVIQTDVVQNKLGWHFPQQRFLTLWQDVAHTFAGDRAPQPLFFRSNTNDTIEFWHTNLVPSYYELDDFQVRTPTDVIGQHIHNVKFDVTSSDGGANGFNYEDGTFSPQEVRDRIAAINRPGAPDGLDPGLLQFDERTGFLDKCATPKTLTVVKASEAYPPRAGAGSKEYGLFGKPPEGQSFDGAQTTIQLWDCDPLLSSLGVERTLRTIFTHDHLGPSTHQQAGLYAGLVVEPQGSLWYLPSGERMNNRLDGGPTNWEGYIVPSDPKKSYREFAIEFQDTQLAYTNTSRTTVSNKLFTPVGNSTTGTTTFDVAAGPPPLSPGQVFALVTILNRNQLPQDFPAIFTANGIRLSPRATVGVVAPSGQWIVQEPTAPGGPAGASYVVWAANVQSFTVPGSNPPITVQSPTSLLVATGPAAFDVAAGPPPLSDQDVAAFVAILDRKQLPQVFPTIFGANGIPLTARAAVTVLTPLAKWQIQEPADPGGLNAGATYIITAANFKTTTVPGVNPPVTVQSPTSLYVATPGIEPGWADPPSALNAVTPSLATPLGKLGAPYPQLVSDGGTATYSMNYRNESVLARVAPLPGDDRLIGKMVDLAYVFNSLTDRNNPALNVQPTPGAPINPAQPAEFKFPPPVAPLLRLGDDEPHVPGVNEPGDPFTPLMRSYVGDRVHVRTLVGAHVLAHSFQIQGVGWDFEPDDPSSGRRNAQAMGISEHFEMQFTVPPFAADHQAPLPPFADYLVAPSSSTSGLANGDWTLMRAFTTQSGTKDTKSYLSPLPNNPLSPQPDDPTPDVGKKRALMAAKIQEITNRFAPLKLSGKDQVVENLSYLNVTATTVSQALPEKKLTFNSRSPAFQLNNILLFVRTADLDANGRLKPDAPREPLILRARAGDWIMVNLVNVLPAAGVNDPAITQTTFNRINAGYPLTASVFTSRLVGLHPALVSYDVTQSNGVNLGFNPDATIGPGESRTYLWYAGDLTVDEDGVHERPVEFGATNLVPADLMVQPQFGMVGALVIEPEGSAWTEDVGSHASAIVTRGKDSFREFVLVGQNLVANSIANPTTSSWGAFNFRTEPFSTRQPPAVPGSEPIPANGTLGYAKAFSNSQIKAADPKDQEPQTPIFRAAAGTAVRFRFVMPSTTTSLPMPFVFDIHGHGWQEEPFSPNGTRIAHNRRSQYFGAQQVAPYEAFNFVLDRAGGRFDVTGDFLYETYQQSAQLGTWGLFRVQAGLVTVTEVRQEGSELTLSGRYQLSRANAGHSPKISVSSGSGPAVDATVDPEAQTWTFATHHDPKDQARFTISSSLGGSTTIDLPLKVSP